MMKFSPKISAVALGLILALSMAGQARADWHDDDRDHWEREHREHEWREHEAREHAWRDHEAREHYYAAPPVYYGTLRPVYYPPPPLVVGVPGLNIVVPLRIH